MEKQKQNQDKSAKEKYESQLDEIESNFPPKEGTMTRKVEQVTAQVPSMTWLWAAIGAMGISAAFATFTEKKGTANFIGLWVPSLLLIGIYNKLVKLEGSDRFDRGVLH